MLQGLTELAMKIHSIIVVLTFEWAPSGACNSLGFMSGMLYQLHFSDILESDLLWTNNFPRLNCGQLESAELLHQTMFCVWEEVQSL